MLNKKFTALIFVFIVCIAVGAVVGRTTAPSQTAPPSSSPAPSASPTSQNCQLDELKASVLFDGAAGSINGNFTIQNISDHVCILPGQNLLRLQYDPMITSINVVSDQPMTPKDYSLAPHDTLVATARIENGPQCSSGILPVDVTYIYDYPKDRALIFKDDTGLQNFPINVCALPKEKTRVTLTSFALSLPD